MNPRTTRNVLAALALVLPAVASAADLPDIVAQILAARRDRAQEIPDIPADAYTRLSLVALADASSPPTLTEGYDRLVTTHSFDPGLVPAP